MIPDWMEKPWFAKPDDLVGGWCIGTDQEPLSSGGDHLADFIYEDVANHVVWLHNEWLKGRNES